MAKGVQGAKKTLKNRRRSIDDIVDGAVGPKPKKKKKPAKKKAK